MTTQTIENYLKALYYLHQKNEEISLSDLGKEVAVSKPTANGMVKRLKTKGWVDYEKYKPLRLTDKGLKLAAIIIRKHRLSEMFLTQIMHFGWEEVHDIAEDLEHINSEKFFDRMDELLGFPSTDPHGSPIPDKDGNFVKPNYKRLSQIDVGSKVLLKALKSSSTDFLLFLNKKELPLGTKITVTQREDFDNSMVVSYNKKKNVVLTESVGNRLLVEVL
jgi:DtxR family Mn-dependent transcriptional regulator